MACGNFVANILGIEATAPAGSTVADRHDRHAVERQRPAAGGPDSRSRTTASRSSTSIVVLVTNTTGDLVEPRPCHRHDHDARRRSSCSPWRSRSVRRHPTPARPRAARSGSRADRRLSIAVTRRPPLGGRRSFRAPETLDTAVSRLADFLLACGECRVTTSPPSASASSSSTAAWARRSSSSTSPARTTAGSPGKCHEALVLNRPDVIEGVHASMLEAGAEVVETDTFQAQPPEARGVGPRRAHARDQPQGRRDRPPAPSARTASSPARSARPASCPPPTTRRSATIRFARARRGLRRAGARPGRGRRRPDHHRDGAGHPRGQGGDLRRARGVQGDRPRGADPGARSRCCPNGGKMLLGTDIEAVLTTLEALEGRRHRPQLLDRARGHARRDPLPRRALAAAGPLHPERRPAAPGPRRRDDLPREARAARRGARRVRRALRRRHRRRLLRHDARAHRARSPSASAAACPAPRPAPGPPRVSLDDDRDRARPGAARRRSSASASTRRARARPRSCCSPTTTTASSRSPRTRSRAARTCSTSASR